MTQGKSISLVATTGTHGSMTSGPLTLTHNDGAVFKPLRVQVSRLPMMLQILSLDEMMVMIMMMRLDLLEDLDMSVLFIRTNWFYLEVLMDRDG